MTTLDDAIVEMVRARPMRVSEIASAAKLAALRLVDSGALVVGDDYVARAADLGMSGWRSIGRVAMLAAQEEGHRARRRAMRAAYGASR